MRLRTLDKHCAPTGARLPFSPQAQGGMVGGVWVALLLSLIFSYSLMNLLIQISGLDARSKRGGRALYRRKTKSQRPRAPAPACSSPKNPRGTTYINIYCLCGMRRIRLWILLNQYHDETARSAIKNL